MNTPEARWNMNSFSQFMPTQLIQAQIAPQDLKKSPPSNPDAPKSSSEVPTDSHKSSAAPVASKTHNQQAHQADTPFRDHHEVTSMPSLKELFFGYLMLVFPTMILLMIRGERLQKRRDAEFQARKEKRLSIEQQEREKKRRAFQEEIDQYIRDNEPKDSSPDA